MLKKLCVVWGCVLVLTGCFWSTTPEPDLTIDINSIYRIVVPDDYASSGCRIGIKQAAKMLQKSFEAAVGRQFPIVQAHVAVDLPGKAIYLGNCPQAEEFPVDFADLTSFDYFIVEQNGDILIAGLDQPGGRGNPRYVRNCVLGTVKGATAFAQKFLQTKFLYPGEIGTEYAPRPGRVTIPRNYCKLQRTPLKFAYVTNYENNYNYANNFFGGGKFFTYGGHSYYDAVPAAKYAKTHPEYFALIDGNRTGQGNHLCISNPQVQELIYREALRRLDAGAEVVQMAQTDGYIPCSCANCRRWGNTRDHGEKIWQLHIKLAKRLLVDRPGKKLHLICYNPTQEPPKTIKEFPPNVIVELCVYSPEQFKKWSNIKVPGGFTVYLYNWGTYQIAGYTPKRTPQYLSDQVKLFVANHVKGFYLCGFGENFGLEGPLYYLFGQLWDDPERDPQQVVADFIKAAFKESAQPMWSFYHELYIRLQLNCNLVPQDLDRQKGILPRDPKYLLGIIYTPDLLEKLEHHLSMAEANARDPKVKKRLEIVRWEFNYAKNLGQIITLYNAYKIAPSFALFEPLAQKIEERQKMVKTILKLAKHAYPNWPGMYLFGGGGGRSMAKIMPANSRLNPIAAPLNWDLKLLRDKKILPGTIKRKMTIYKADQAVGQQLDFEEGAWRKAAWHQLQGIKLDPVKYKNQFKALYDDQAIYFALQGDSCNASWLTLGRDAPVWTQDCADLFLDPTCTRMIYYHFIANPTPNSYYDEACGLITDPLHLLYNKADKNWNGKWQYFSKIADGKWRIMIRVPFKTLDTTMPLPGAKWLMNFGRETYPGNPQANKNKRGDQELVPELSLWSPNFESPRFNDPEIFGELVFK